MPSALGLISVEGVRTIEYRLLGRTGLRVSELCLGTMTFGESADQRAADAIVGLALDAGVNFVDTANTYGKLQSETMLGKALKGRRRDVVLATKVFNPTGPNPNDSGSSRRHIMRAVEDSLRRLDTDHIDIYYIHHVDPDTHIEEVLRALDDLVRQGKILYPACSNFEAWRLLESIWTSDTNGLARFVCYQPQYNLVVRDIEEELVPVCRLKDLGIVVWSPLASGFLTGKYEQVTDFEPARKRAFFSPKADAIIAEVRKVADELGCTPSQVGLRWVMDSPGITAAIIGARTPEQAKENLLAATVTLPDSAMDRLNSVSGSRRRYPRAMEDNRTSQRLAAIKMPSLTE